MNKKISYWEIVGVVGIIIIFLWIILKILNVIHSPVWIEMLPFLGGGLTAGSILQIVRDTKQDVKELKKEVKQIDNRVIHIEAWKGLVRKRKP